MNKRKGRKRRGLNKAQAQRAHAKRRARERFGLSFNKKQRQDVIDIIQSGCSVLLWEESNRLAWHGVNYGGQRMRVLYDRHRHQPVTVLPLVDKR